MAEYFGTLEEMWEDFNKNGTPSELDEFDKYQIAWRRNTALSQSIRCVPDEEFQSLLESVSNISDMMF